MAAPGTIGFIGIGNMGRHMAANLVKAGHAVIAYDRDTARSEAWANEAGGAAAGSLAELAEAANAVITMLPRGADVRQAVMEAEGGAVAKAMAGGGIIVDMSSSEPLGTQELGAELARNGTRLIDAPVSGGTTGAKKATLAIMVGGEDDTAIEAVWPLFEAMGENLFRTGPLGSGHAIKALNNFVSATNYAAASEALLVGQKFGLEPDVIIDVINASSGRNSSTQGLIPAFVLNRKFDAGFFTGLMAKDVGIAEGLARGVGIEAPVAELVSRLWNEARDALGPESDFSGAIRHWESRNGMEIKKTR